MSHVSTLKLHQLRLGELPAEEAAKVHAHLGTCARCQARLAHQAATRRAFEATAEPLAPSRPTWSRAARYAAPLLAAALVLAVLVPGLYDPPRDVSPSESEAVAHPVASPTAVQASTATAEPGAGAQASPSVPAAPSAAPVTEAQVATSPPPTTRTKGATVPRLEAWVLVGESPRPLYAGEVLGAGCRVQLRYDAHGRRFVTLAGRDSQGNVEVYATLAAGERGLSTAPFALTLDATPGEQVFYALLTDTRPLPAAVEAALAEQPVRMPGAIVTSLSVQKD